ncbi:hypothetical protein ACNKHP_18260 [Shigella boydii]
MSCYAAVPLLALAFLLGRVAWLQVISPDMLVKEGDMRSLRVQAAPPAGMITDRSGRPVSGERAGKAIWADPKEVHDAGVSASVTAGRRWLTRSIPHWISFQPALTPTRKGGFIYLARQVNPDMADYVEKTETAGVTCVKSLAVTIRPAK